MSWKQASTIEQNADIGCSPTAGKTAGLAISLFKAEKEQDKNSPCGQPMTACVEI